MGKNGGLPSEIENLERLGLTYILKYTFGTDGLGFKIYPTEKAIKLFELTNLSGKYRTEDIQVNLDYAKASERYFYITGKK